MVKNLLAKQETWIQSLGRGDPLEKGMATHSSTLAWRIAWTEHDIADDVENPFIRTFILSLSHGIFLLSVASAASEQCVVRIDLLDDCIEGNYGDKTEYRLVEACGRAQPDV